MARHCNSVAHGGESSAKRKARGGGGVMLFGVILTARRPPVKKSKSMGNLSLSLAIAEDSDDEYDGQRSPVTRKKAIPWTEEEHRQFLIGLQVLGKGDWLGISRNYVPSKTPSQVASHAQKYYMHLSNPLKKKRRVSVFDKVSSVEINSSMPGRSRGDDGKELMLSLSLGVYVDALELSLKPPSGPLPYQQWAPNAYPLMDAGAGLSQQQIFRPVPVTPEERINQMLRLTLGVTRAVQIEPSALSLRPPGMPMM